MVSFSAIATSTVIGLYTGSDSSVEGRSQYKRELTVREDPSKIAEKISCLDIFCMQISKSLSFNRAIYHRLVILRSELMVNRL